MVADEIEQSVDGLGVSAKLPARFTENDLSRMQRATASAQDVGAPFVPLIGCIEPADERPGINDVSYFHSLRERKGRTVPRTSPGMARPAWRNQLRPLPLPASGRAGPVPKNSPSGEPGPFAVLDRASQGFLVSPSSCNTESNTAVKSLSIAHSSLPSRRAARSRELRKDRFHFRVPNRSCAGKKEASREAFGAQRSAIQETAGSSCLAGGEFRNSLFDCLELAGGQVWQFLYDFAYTHDVEIIYPPAPRESFKLQVDIEIQTRAQRESIADQSSCEQLVALPSSPKCLKFLSDNSTARSSANFAPRPLLRAYRSKKRRVEFCVARSWAMCRRLIFCARCRMRTTGYFEGRNASHARLRYERFLFDTNVVSELRKKDEFKCP